jgi:long-chain acyl-CoA synthetase
MAWPEDPLPATRHEVHFGDRLVRCFADRPPSVFAMFEESLAANPDGLALVDADQRLTYRELAGRVEGLTTILAARGVRVRDRVAFLLGNRAPFLISLLACARLGAIAVPLNTREQRDGLAYMLAQSGSKLLVHDAELAARLPDLAATPMLRHWLRVEGHGFGDLPGECPNGALPPVHRPAEEDVAVILYTSGTTGRPKGAMLTHLNIAHSVVHYRLAMDLTAQDRSLLAVPASHVTGLVAILLAMVHVGGTIVAMPEFNAQAFLELAAAERITHTVLVPAMYNLCLRESDFAAFDLSAWRIGAYGGAPMPAATLAHLAELLPNLDLMNAYGATETTSPTSLMPRGHTAGHADSVGRAVPCAEVRIMDPRGREVAPGEPGEVWIHGPMVIPGYWANNQATADAFTAGFWRSGDVGALDGDGYLYVLDRLKDMVNRAGYKVFGAEVESVLSHCPGVLEAAVVARPDPVLGEKTQAFVRVADATIGTETLRAFCAERLAEYKVPDFITILPEPLPRNAAGKVLKAVLRERVAREVGACAPW